MDDLSFGMKVKLARIQMGLSLTELASKIGYSSPYLSGVERGKEIPKMELVSKLASALKIDLIELVKLAAILKIDSSKELPSEDREAIISFYRVKHKTPSKNSSIKDKVAGNGH
jgi:transcriptional regulator with XRE-family HTH domain